MNSAGIKLSWMFSLAFLLATIIAYIPNPLVGPNALFVTNGVHNLVHLLTAIAFAFVARLGNEASIKFMIGFGLTYLLVGALGFWVTTGSGEGMLLGLVHINTADNFLHLGLAVAILTGGVFSRFVTQSSRCLQEANPVT